MTFAAMDFWRRRGASDEPASSVLRRMQAASAGAEGDVRLFQVAGNRRGAVPQTRAAVDAFLAVERRHATITERNGLTGASLDANFRATFLAQFRIQEHD